METEKSIDNLLSLTKIDSKEKIKALKLHFVNGMDIGLAAELAGIPQPHLSKVISDINTIAEKCEKYHENKTYHLTSIKENSQKALSILLASKDSFNPALIEKAIETLQEK